MKMVMLLAYQNGEWENMVNANLRAQESSTEIEYVTLAENIVGKGYNDIYFAVLF